MSGHTPGPWYALKNHRNALSRIEYELGGERYTLASELSTADAALIAAAPELLDALRSVGDLGLLDSDEKNSEYCNDELAKARAAILKALGDL